MKKSVCLSLCFGCLVVLSASAAVDFKKSKVTQVVNDVQIISAADQAKKSAAVNDIFTMPDILRTGAASRAELVAEDDTVTRVGANTIFSFDPASRTIDLQQGSLLFHSPHGKGGGTIHTGSATASVLGSTLIVTTTPNGGFKVIALEDEAEIKFLNGLHQHLEPGQMTFILPGGSQLAPIIIFRLDDLIRNSLLVKGFNQPLSSLPLILDQVDKQTKLIKSGRASDTGLVAGDNATPSQVEVLDASSIESGFSPSQLKTALAADATINQPSLKDVTIPAPPNHVFLNPSFTLAGNTFFGSRTFSGFAARNIFINTPAANLDSLTVDLSPYADKVATKPEFDFVAGKNLNIEGSVTFAGLPAGDSLFLIAGNQITLAPDITVQADVADFELSAPGALALDGISLINNAGDIGITSGSDITMTRGHLIHAAGHLNIAGDLASGNLSIPVAVSASAVLPSGSPAVSSFFNPGSDVILSGDAGVSISKANIIENIGAVYVESSGGDVNVSGLTMQSDTSANIAAYSGSVSISGNSAISAGSYVNLLAVKNLNVDGATLDADLNHGGVSMQSSLGSVTVRNTSIHAGYLQINSGDGILLDGKGETFAVTGTVNLTALNTINLNNVDFSSIGVLNMIASTVTVVGVNLPLITNVGTPSGNVNVNGPVKPFWFNIINSSWMNTPITSASQVAVTSGPVNAPGVHSYATGGN